MSNSSRSSTESERSRVFIRDIEPDPGWEVLVVDPGDDIVLEPGAWTELVPFDNDAVERVAIKLAELQGYHVGPLDIDRRSARALLQAAGGTS